MLVIIDYHVRIAGAKIQLIIKREEKKIRKMWLYFFANYNISLAIHAQASASAKALFISLIYQIHHNFHHHILLFSLALCYHQS